MENKKFHILIVDDDNRIRDLLKDYLSNNDYIVSTAENAEEAKKKLIYFLQEEDYNILLLGVELLVLEQINMLLVILGMELILNIT